VTDLGQAVCAVPTVYIRTLKRAAEITGGEEELARRLKVTPSHLVLWIRGVVPPSGDVFLRAADIVNEHDLQQMAVKQPPQVGGA
jgi:transcriptional regulator with XRE-family HTH domain